MFAVSSWTTTPAFSRRRAESSKAEGSTSSAWLPPAARLSAARGPRSCQTAPYADRPRLAAPRGWSRLRRAASRPAAVRVGGIPDVDHDEGRLRRANEGEQLRGVPGLSDHLKAGTLEQTRQ